MMMKNKKISFAVCLLVTGLFFSRPASAQLLFGATFDGAGDVKSTVQTVQAKLAAIQEQVVAVVKENVTKVKAGAEKYLGKITKIVDKVPGTKDFEEGSSVDIYNTEAVKEAFTELFLQYPTDDERLMKAYEKKGEDFFYDTLVEMKTAVIELESQLSTLRKEVENFSTDAMSGAGTDASSSEDENGVNYNAYMANRKFNDILKITEQLVAMQNQYYAARLLRSPRPFPPAEIEKESSSSQKTSYIYGHETMAFAQMLDVRGLSNKKPTSATAQTIQSKSLRAEKTDAVAVSPKNNVVQNKAKIKSRSKIADLFVVPAAPATSALMEGSETELAALSRISEAQKVVNSAVEVHNMLQQMPAYRDLYKQYELFKQLHKKATLAVQSADQCVVKYVGRRYDNPNKVWFGQDENLTLEQTCDYNARKGLSGWSIAAFQLANASVGNDLDVDAFAEADVDSSSNSDTLIEANAEELEKNNASQNTDNAFANPSKAQEFSDSVREVELVNWQIGRKAAQYLVQDQYSANPVYGKAAHPYPLWNDQRSYYNQYLSGKYENMKAYLKGLDLTQTTLEIAETFNSGETEGDEKSSNKRGLNKIADYLKKNPSGNSRSTQLLAKKAAALAEVMKKQNAEVAPYETKLTELSKKIDSVSELINTTTKEVNEVDEKAALNENKAEAAKKEMDIMSERGSTGGSGYALAKLTLQEAGDAHANAITKLGRLRSDLVIYEARRDELNNEKTKAEDKVKDIKQSYQEEIVAVENEYDEQIASLQSTGETARKLLTLYSNLELKDHHLQELISKVDGLVDKARSCAVDLIQAHQDDLSSMVENDVLYLPANNGTIVAKHAALIEKLKKMPKDCFTQTVKSAIGIKAINPDSVVSTLVNIYKSALTSSVCSNYTCDAADTQYFVGLPAKARDFTAPRAALMTHYPAVRDMVHLDTTDYKKIEMSKDGKVSRGAFLDYGLSQPYVWELMLSDKGYVERGMDLSAALDLGGEARTFMRGNIMPCRVGNSYMIDVTGEGKYAVVDVNKTNNPENTKKLASLSECNELIIKGIVPGIAHLIDTYVILDKDVDSTILGNSLGAVEEPTSSELGMFLRYKKGSLRISERAYDGYSRLIAKEKKAEKSGKYELNAEDNMYQRAMFTKNQIGDFLHFVDKENNIKKNVDEISASMADTIAGLREIFEGMGFKLKEDLNLADSADYDYVVRKLKERKNTLVSEAREELDTIPTANSTVKERYDKVDNTYMALVQDSKALVNLSSSTQSGSPLAESIKTEETNQKVVEKARNEGYSAIQKEIDNYEQPICMPY